MAGTILLAAAMLANAVLSGASEVRVGREVRLGDVARVSGGRAERLRSIVVAHMPEGGSIQIDRAALAALVRRAVPGLKLERAPAGTIRLVSTASPPLLVQHSCFSALRSLPVGAPVGADALAPAPCDDRRAPARVGRDPRTGEARAAAPVAAGDYLGRLWLAEAPAVRAGDRLTLVSISGPVRISRRVTALQPGRARDKKLFVVAGDGAVFSAPFDGKEGP
jgi:hypothetical protein